MKVKSESEVAQLCSTLRNPMDCSPPGSSVHGIFQARILESGAIALVPQIELLEIYPREIKTDIYTKTCTWMFITALFIEVMNPSRILWPSWAQKPFPVPFPEGRFKQLLFREWRGCGDKGGAVKKQQGNHWSRVLVPFKGYTLHFLWAFLQN